MHIDDIIQSMSPSSATLQIGQVGDRRWHDEEKKMDPKPESNEDGGFPVGLRDIETD